MVTKVRVGTGSLQKQQLRAAVPVFRGLIPRKSVTTLQAEEATDFKIASKSEGQYSDVYTDGAGAGKDQRHLPRYAQKVGAAAVAIDVHENGEVSRCDFILAAVPGEQTVPRAELHGFNFSGSLSMQCQAVGLQWHAQQM